MTGTLHVAWDDRLTRYDFGPGHPLAPVRVELTVELAHDFGVLKRPGGRWPYRSPPPRPRSNWCTTPAYIGAGNRDGGGAVVRLEIPCPPEPPQIASMPACGGHRPAQVSSPARLVTPRATVRVPCGRNGYADWPAVAEPTGRGSASGSPPSPALSGPERQMSR